MVKCTNGMITCTVTEGAYENYFKSQGFYLAYEETEAVNIAYEETYEEIEPEIVEAVDVFDELLKRPISQWTKSEVKEFAAAKGIDITGTRNVNQAKEIIKAYIEEN